jgi:arylsulfatase A-like enzyme
VGDQGAGWLARHADRRFAAWVSFPGPHDPYDPPEEMAALYYDAPIPEPVGSREELKTKPRAQQSTERMARSSVQYQLDLLQAKPEHHRRWRAHYYANITLIDEGIGKIVAALEQAGVLDRTLIVFTSDHGDALGDHGLVYKSFFYECMARVPLIVRGPGVAAGQRCRSLVSTLDLVPLFYNTCGVKPPPGLQGLELAPLLADPSRTLRETVVSENLGAVMVRDARFKYAHYRDGDSELYDLGSDPHEVVNLAGHREYGPQVSKMRGLLVEHALECNAARARMVQRPPDPRRAALDSGFRQPKPVPAV